jgi:hypothetical protein
VFASYNVFTLRLFLHKLVQCFDYSLPLPVGFCVQFGFESHNLDLSWQAQSTCKGGASKLC